MSSADSSTVARTVLAAAAGGVTAAFAGPVIAAWAGSMFVASVGAGIMGSTVTVFGNNVMKPPLREVRYHPHAAQQRFRGAVSGYLDGIFEPILNAIRRNQDARFEHSSVFSTQEVQSVVSFAFGQTTALGIDVRFHVQPRADTQERALEDSTPPQDLRNHADPEETAEYVLTDSLQTMTDSIYDGIGWSMLRGAALGAVGGCFLPLAPAWYFFETAPGVAGVILGIPSVVGGATSAVELATAELSAYERVAHAVNFAAEVKENINRVLECAASNGVGLEYDITVGVGRRVRLAGDVAGGQNSQEIHGEGVDIGETWLQEHGRLH